MFDGTLGVYPHKEVHIDIDPNAKPVHSRPYPVPQIHLKTFKKELDHFVRIVVLAAQQESEWASPSFIIPKKDGRVRLISNLRQLNKVIRHKQYMLPIITDILCVLGTSFSQNLVLVCNTIRLNLTKKVKISVALLLHLANIST
jgi:hypothetical protein